MAIRARWTLVTLPVAAALLVAASFPTASAEERVDGIVLADGHASGRFVSFDVEAGAVCDWTFEGRAVIDAMVGVGGDARTQGRSVVVDGDADGPRDGDPCGASAGHDQEEPEEPEQDDEQDEDAQGNTTGTGGSGGNGTSTSRAPSRTATSSATGPSASVRAHLHDNPSGIITLDLDAGEELRIDFDEDLALRTQSNKVIVEGDGMRASLFASGGGDDGVDVRVEGSSVAIEAEADARVHFRVGDAELDDDEDEAVEEHVDEGDVSCEVFVSDDDEPHVVAIGEANVTVAAVHTTVSVDLDIDVDVDVHVGGGSTTTASASPTPTRTVTQTQTQTQTRTATSTTTTTSADGGTTTVAGGAGCGCAQTVLILDVDVTVLVLDADDDLLVRLNGELLAQADSVEDALRVEAGEDPEALVVVDQEQEVKVLLSLAEGRNQVTMERQDGQQFQTREPVRYDRTTTLSSDDDGFAPVNDVDPDRGNADAGTSDDDGGADVSVPGFGWGLALLAVTAGALVLRRRLD